MGELPKRFPEYSLMYKTILNQIKKLEDTKRTPGNKNEIQIKIENYKIELDKIKKMFPENFFDN